MYIYTCIICLFFRTSELHAASVVSDSPVLLQNPEQEVITPFQIQQWHDDNGQLNCIVFALSMAFSSILLVVSCVLVCSCIVIITVYISLTQCR